MRRQGPLLAEPGVPVVISLAFAGDFMRELKPELPAGEWFLEPVDDGGLPVTDAKTISFRLPRAPGRPDLTAMMKDVGDRLMARVRADPDLDSFVRQATTSDSALLARALGEDVGDLLLHSFGKSDPAQRERETERITTDTISRLRQMRDTSRPLGPVSLCRPAVYALARDPVAITDERIVRSLRDGDYEDATARVLARFRSGVPVPFVIVAHLIPAVAELGVAAALVGLAAPDPQGVPLAALAMPHHYPDTPAGVDRAIAMLCAGWKLVPATIEHRVSLAMTARVLTTYEATSFGAGVLAVLIRDMIEAGLAGWVSGWTNEATPEREALESVRAIERFVRADASTLVQALPEHPVRPPRLMRRAQASAATTTPIDLAPSAISRNALCACGSGKKYKRCCDARRSFTPANGNASPAQPRISDEAWTAWLGTHAGELEALDLEALPIGDLMRLPLRQLAYPQLRCIERRLRRCRRFDLAARVLDVLAECDGGAFAEDVETLRHELVFEAVHVTKDYDLVAAEKPKLKYAWRSRPALAARELNGPNALTELSHMLAFVADNEHGRSLAQTAHLLMSSENAFMWGLGRVVARAALLYELTEGERAALRLAIKRSRAMDVIVGPDDPIVARWQALVASAADGLDLAHVQAELTDLEALATEQHAVLAAHATREHELQARVAELEARCAELAAVVAASASDEEERRALRAKNEQLKAIIADGNAEREALRAQLEIATAGAVDTSAAPLSQHTGDDDDEAAEVVEPPHRRVLTLRFERAARNAFEHLPTHIAGEGMRTLGSLAARDHAAWRGVKLAKDMGRQILMARVGIHHRLIVAIDDDQMAVLDLVSREALLTVLKRLRGTFNPKSQPRSNGR